MFCRNNPPPSRRSEERRPQGMQLPAFHVPGPASIAGVCTNRRTGRTGECRARAFLRQPRNKCRGLHGRQGWSARGMQKPAFFASNPASNTGVCIFSAPRTKMPGVCMVPGMLRWANPAETSAPPREIGEFAWSTHTNPCSLCREIGLHTDSRISCADFRTEHKGLHGWQGQRTRAMQTPAFYVPYPAQIAGLCMGGGIGAREDADPPPFMHQTPHQTKGLASPPLPHRPPRAPSVVSAVLVCVEQNRCCVSDEQQPIPAREDAAPASHASNPAPNEGVCIAAPAPSAAPRPGRRICSARLPRAKPLLHFRRTAADPRARTSELQRSFRPEQTVAAFPTFGSRPPRKASGCRHSRAD